MKTCIISGTSSGIGKETAILLSRKSQFDNIVMLGRNLAQMKYTLGEMDDGVHTDIWEIDFKRPENIPAVVSGIYKKYRQINCLLNIAGYAEPDPLLSTTLENMLTTYSVNVFSPFVLMRECVRYMKKSGGKILNIASTAGMSPRPGWISYASSKAAVISMSQTLTDELAEYGIKVYCVSPGRCATELRKRLAPDEDPSSIMQPDEVAKIISSLIDSDEKCLDGQNIIIRKRI